MSSGVAPPVSQLTSSSSLPALDAEKYIDRRLEETRRHVRAVDLTVALLRLCIGLLGFLLAAALLDHWVFSGGLGRGARLALWGVLVFSAGWYCARVLFPLLLHRINPIFAAQTIEQTRPSFKNGLINLLLLRREPDSVQGDELSKRVYAALQVRTASELSQVTVGTTVDRLHVIRLGYLLATLVAICCAYLVISPKNPLVSFGRVILPWARIGAPTRVTIEKLTPGDTTAYQGDPLTVSAEVRGLQASEPVRVYYSSADGHSVDQSVDMSVPEGGFRYQADLPAGGTGLQENLLYWVAAGDSCTPKYQVEVQIPLAMVVDRVEYEYPAYTGLGKSLVLNDGNLSAIEGTRVTIHGAANYPVAHAFIELLVKAGDSRPTVPMAPEGSSATGQLTLTLNPADPSQQEFDSYQLRFNDPEQRTNRHPTRYSVAIIPDKKPDVRLVDPPDDPVQIPVTGSLDLKVRAEDPDFGLRRVQLRAEREGRGLVIPLLLDKSRPAPPHRGPFEKPFRFEPARLGLKPGDRITYWAEAVDCMERAADPGFVGNASETERRTILIVGQDPRQQPSSKPRTGQGAAQKGQPDKQQADAERQPDAKTQPGGEGQQPGTKQDDKQPPAGKDSDRSKPQPDENPASKDGAKDNSPKDKPKDSPKDGPKDSPQGGNESQPGNQSDASQSPESGQQGQKSGQKSGSESGDKPKGNSEQNKDKSPAGQSGAAGSDSDSQDDPGGKDSGQPSSGKSGGKRSQSDANSESSGEPVKGDIDPASAIQKILAHRKQEHADPQGNQGGEAAAKSDTQPGSEKPEPSPPGKPSSGSPASQGENMPADPARKSDAQQPADGEHQGNNSQTKGSDAKGAATKDNMDKGPANEDKANERKGDNAAGVDAKSSAAPKGDKAKTDSPKSQGMKEGTQADAKPSEADTQRDAAKSQKGSSGGEKSAQGKESQSDASTGQSGDGAKSPGKQEKKTGDKSSQPQDGGDPSKGESPKAAKKPDKGGSNADPTKAGKAMPETKSDAAEPGKAPTEPEKKPGDASAADAKSNPQSAGAEKPGAEKSAKSSPQESGQDPKKKQEGSGASKKSQGGEDPAQSPSISPKPSKSKSDTEGDRSGEGQKGGGQNSPQQGAGTPGSQTESPQGTRSDEKGDSDKGTRGGDQVKSDQPKGNPSMSQGDGKGASAKGQPGGSDAAKKPQPGDPSQKHSDGAKGAASNNQPPSGENKGEKGGAASANPLGGGQPSAPSAGPPPPPAPAPGPDDPNLEYASKQTTLALDHLSDELAKDKSGLLKQLGWDKAYAEQWLRQWEQMMKTAKQPGPQGDTAKRELDKALRSLGLRPTQSRVQKGQAGPDKVDRLQDTGRYAPPPEWMDYSKAYSEGISASKE